MIAAASGATLQVRTVGQGLPLLFIPSHGRGVGDFDSLARLLARKGYMSILPEPRGINGSTGPAPTTLFDLAEDSAAVIGSLCKGPIGVVGHAFGNRVARALATRHPELVTKVALLAGGGEVPIPPAIMAALEGSLSQGRKPDNARLRDLQLAFFAKGHNARPWLQGWYPETADRQMAAVRATPARLWWTAGEVPLLLIQAAEDPIAPNGNAEALKRDVGARLTLIVLKRASHAMLPEQPGAITIALAGYFRRSPPSPRRLQQQVDRAIRRP